MAPSVALLAILVADTENTDHPYNRKLKAKFTSVSHYPSTSERSASLFSFNLRTY